MCWFDLPTPSLLNLTVSSLNPSSVGQSGIRHLPRNWTDSWATWPQRLWCAMGLRVSEPLRGGGGEVYGEVRRHFGGYAEESGDCAGVHEGVAAGRAGERMALFQEVYPGRVGGPGEVSGADCMAVAANIKCPYCQFF